MLSLSCRILKRFQIGPKDLPYLFMAVLSPKLYHEINAVLTDFGTDGRYYVTDGTHLMSTMPGQIQLVPKWSAA